MTTMTRGRLPSFDVQRDTRAALAAASVDKRLPTSLADIGGLIVTEKNTFINIREASDCFEDFDRDLDLDQLSINDVSGRERKKTDGFALPPVRERCYSSMSSRARRTSCPPTMFGDTDVGYVSSLVECEIVCSNEKSDVVSPTCSSIGVSTPPQAAYRSRRHYSIDLQPSLTTMSPSTTSPSSPLKPVDETSASTLPATPTDSTTTTNMAKTTVMLRNVPYSESQLGVLNLLEQRGFRGRFDFFYAPLDFSSGNNLGYAFINLPEGEAVSEFFTVFDGLRIDKEGWSQKDLQVCWARVQGVDPNVEHYRNSPVNDMPENFRPMIFDAQGEQLPFPRPDENVPRRPIPTQSMYSGNRATNRPRFASAHLPSAAGSSGGPNPASRRRHGGGPSGSFSATTRATQL